MSTVFKMNSHVTIVEDVVLVLVQQCVSDFTPKLKLNHLELFEFLSKSMKKGIAVRQEENGLYITVKVSLLYGSDLMVCLPLQQKIMEDIKEMLGLEVVSVTVKVEAVHFEE